MYEKNILMFNSEQHQFSLIRKYEIPTSLSSGKKGRIGKNDQKYSLPGKTQGIWKFCQNTGKFFAQVVNSLILKMVQCSKLRMHPAPCGHGFNAGCMILKVVHPACAPFTHIFSVYLLLCFYDLNSGRTHFPPSAPGGCKHFEH